PTTIIAHAGEYHRQHSVRERLSGCSEHWIGRGAAMVFRRVAGDAQRRTAHEASTNHRQVMIPGSDVYASRLERFTVVRLIARETALSRETLGEHGGEDRGHVLRDEHGQREVTRKTGHHYRERVGAARACREREYLRLEVTAGRLNVACAVYRCRRTSRSGSCNGTNLRNHLRRRCLDAKNAAAARRWFVHVVHRAKGERAHGDLCALLCQRAGYEYTNAWMSLHDQRQRGKAVHHRHLDVQQDDVYLLQSQGVERVPPVHRGSRHAHVVLLIHNPAKHTAHDG